jgi:hypothetical protein
MALLVKDAWHTQRWKDKINVFIKPTGWRPSDVLEKYPVYKIGDVYDFEKYDTAYTKRFLIFTWAQLIILLLFVSYLFGNIAAIGSPAIFVYGAFLFLFVYALAEAMDKSRYALMWQVLKALAGCAMIVYYGDWFKADRFSPLIKYFLMSYFVLSGLLVAWFVLYDDKVHSPAVAM